jgi:ERCC4-related helicase
MPTIESLGLSANQWQFLSDPETYVEVSNRSGRNLVLESTRRQFLTARDILTRLNGSHGQDMHRGVLLADDVGLGKTVVAALVAWVIAAAGERRGVRILAPNDVVARHWEEELLSHVDPLRVCAPSLKVRKNSVKRGKVKLSAGTIQVVKHSYAAQDNLNCDLLIVDEAHRARGENTAFSNALKSKKKAAQRVLILTATPFSIKLEELKRMLTLIGGEAAHAQVTSFSRVLNDLYVGDPHQSPEGLADRLATRAKAAVDALSSFVIRHGIDDIPREQSSIGRCADWNIAVRPAIVEELELIARMDRTRRLAQDDGSHSSKVTNDPRFHVGWRFFDREREHLKDRVLRLNEPEKSVVENQLKAITQLRKEVGLHPKMAAVSAEVKARIDEGEKVILFCHHHATAQELTAHLASTLPKVTARRMPAPSIWNKAWDEVLAEPSGERRDENLRATFVKWLCADLIRAQTWNWLCAPSASETNLVKSLQTTRARHDAAPETVAEAANRLYHALLQSKSSRAVLKVDRLELLPGANGTSRVLAVCDASDNSSEKALFIHNDQPDTVISIFNSPFGPDVLIVTDRLSEGIDLHRYCRHLIHYELSPSPIRTVQRNGRLRRVNSWAAVTDQPILYAYPAWAGTRDHRLVQIMKKRIDSFSLLLGGVQDINVSEMAEGDEDWRSSVIQMAKTRMAKAGGQLRAR